MTIVERLNNLEFFSIRVELTSVLRRSREDSFRFFEEKNYCLVISLTSHRKVMRNQDVFNQTVSVC